MGRENILLLGYQLVLDNQCLLAENLEEDCIIMIEITVDMKIEIIADIYSPQTCREKIFKHVQNVIEALGPERDTTVLMGDFNSVMNNECDIISGEQHKYREVEGLNHLVVNLNLHDS